MAQLSPLPLEDRREFALARLRDGAMILPAAPLRFKNGDSEYRYRPDSELVYTTGWTGPDLIAVLRGFADRDRFVLFVPERDAEAELWTGVRKDPEALREELGADAVYPLRDFVEQAPRLLSGGDRIYYRLGSSPVCDAAMRRSLEAGRRSRPRKGVGPHILADPGAILDAMRRRKDPAEIERMKRAADISVAAFREALASLRPDAFEWEVEATLEGGFRRRGADGPAFSTIVGAGVNGCTLHYVDNASRICSDDLVLLDAGAEVECYAADITRTAPASGVLAGAHRDVYQVVLSAQRAALRASAPGATLLAIHEETTACIASGLIDLGAVEGPVERVLEEEAYRPFFPHRTSHWLGLDTHDVGAYQTHAGPVELEAGMAFTVEPGLYFRPGSCPRMPSLEGIGVRIEDDVVVTEDGVDVLTSDLPTDGDEVAALVAG